MEYTNKETSTMGDAELVALLRGGEQNAFTDLMHRHWRKSVDLGCFFLHNRVDAEDCVQNAFVKAYEHLNQYQGDAEFSTWLGRIVANECLMLMRVRRRTRFVYLDESPSDARPVPIQLAGTGPDPEGDVAYSQLTDALRFEVRRIPPLLRNVMLLTDIKGLPIRDVADQLGITVSAAKSRVVRARAELRLRMMRHYSGGRGSSPLSKNAAPLDRVGRHCPLRLAC
jgi:RNA polymerase sigma-70 factor (ECF subfamily)